MGLLFRGMLALHIIGIVMMAGTTMIDYLTYKTFWKLADAGDMRSLGLIPLMARYGVLVRTGALIILVAGMSLMAIEKGAVWSQTWFRIKFILVIAVVLNGILVGNRQGHKLREVVMTHAPDFHQFTIGIRENMNWFYPIQLALFVAIVLLSFIRFTS